MTRSWSFTMPTAGVWLSLWNDIITQDSTFTDQFFQNAAFVPSMVSFLEIRNQTANSALQRALDSKKEAGFVINGNAADVIQMPRNSIDLKNVYLKTDTALTVISVQIIAT